MKSGYVFFAVFAISIGVLVGAAGVSCVKESAPVAKHAKAPVAHVTTNANDIVVSSR